MEEVQYFFTSIPLIERDKGDGTWADAWMGKRMLGKAGRLMSCLETETVKQKGGQMRGWVKESGDRQTPC